MVENMFETIDATEAEFHFDSNPAGSRPNATEDMVADVHESAISRRSLVWVHYTPKDWAYNGEGSGERALWARNRNLGVRQCPRRGERLEKPSLSCSR
jgi:hypothetical protein